MKKVLPVISASILSFVVLTSVSYGAIIECGNYGQSACTFNDAVKFVNNTVSLIINWSAYIAVITITIAGARILLHPDNSGERTKAKEMFMKTVYGFFFFFCSFLIVKLIVTGLGVNESGTNIFRFLKFK